MIGSTRVFTKPASRQEARTRRADQERVAKEEAAKAAKKREEAAKRKRHAQLREEVYWDAYRDWWAKGRKESWSSVALLGGGLLGLVPYPLVLLYAPNKGLLWVVLGLAATLAGGFGLLVGEHLEADPRLHEAAHHAQRFWMQVPAPLHQAQRHQPLGQPWCTVGVRHRRADRPPGQHQRILAG